MTALLAWAISLLTPFKKYLAIFGVVATVLGAVFLKGRSAGKAAEKAQREAAVAHIERQWDAIDRAPGVADAAFDSLRRRNSPGR